MAKEARALELRREELKHEVKQRLAEVEKRHIVALDEKARDVRNSQQKETKARKAAEHGERGLLTEKETTRGLRDQAKLDGQKVSMLEKSSKLKEEELSSLTAKHRELGENHSRVSLELAEVRQQAEDGFKHAIAASTDVAARVCQLERHAELSGLAPDCRSLPEVAEFLLKMVASIRSTKNRTALQLRTD